MEKSRFPSSRDSGDEVTPVRSWTETKAGQEQLRNLQGFCVPGLVIPQIQKAFAASAASLPSILAW